MTQLCNAVALIYTFPDKYLDSSTPVKSPSGWLSRQARVAAWFSLNSDEAVTGTSCTRSSPHIRRGFGQVAEIISVRKLDNENTNYKVDSRAQYLKPVTFLGQWHFWDLFFVLEEEWSDYISKAFVSYLILDNFSWRVNRILCFLSQK